jgi:hypothetical protein
MFATQTQNISESQSTEEEYEIAPKDRVPIKLASIRELREEVMEVAHNGALRIDLK